MHSTPKLSRIKQSAAFGGIEPRQNLIESYFRSKSSIKDATTSQVSEDVKVESVDDDNSKVEPMKLD